MILCKQTGGWQGTEGFVHDLKACAIKNGQRGEKDLKLLLVDDEKLSLEVMKTHADWKSMHVDQVYTAYHADGARRILENTEIDIIICDIEMPGESGLELMKWLGQHDKRIIKILLSCHKDFNYAAEAIRYGVFSYLLKPVDMEELTRTIEQAEKELVKMDAQKGKIIRIRERKGGWRALREQFWYELVNGFYNNSAADYIRWQASEKYAVFYEDRQLTPVMVYACSDRRKEVDYGEVSYAIKNVLGELLVDAPDAPPAIALSAERFILLLTEERVSDSERLAQDFQKARHFFEKYYEISLDYLVGNKSTYEKWSVQIVLLNARADSIAELQIVRKEDSMIKKAVRYLKDDPSLNREELSKKLFLSPPHLARLFKKGTGQTLNEYATGMRIEEAKYLLAYTTKSISWIASQLSYQNFSYFSRLFKKETGMSPVQYREKMQEDYFIAEQVNQMDSLSAGIKG